MSCRSALTVLILAFLFNACTKSNSTNPGSSRLARVECGIDSIGYTLFNYNAQNLITEVIDSNSQGHAIKTVITYNSQDKPYKFTRFSVFNPFSVQIDSLAYNGNQQVIKKIIGPYYDGPYLLTNTYAYDTKGRLIADTNHAYAYINNDNSYVITGYRKYSYDGNENITQVQYFVNTGTFAERSVTNITYDTRPNPFIAIGWLAYFERAHFGFLFDEYYFPSKNNILTISHHDFIDTKYDFAQTYDYGYEDNKIKTLTIRYKAVSTNYMMPVKFFYE